MNFRIFFSLLRTQTQIDDWLMETCEIWGNSLKFWRNLRIFSYIVKLQKASTLLNVQQKPAVTFGSISVHYTP